MFSFQKKERKYIHAYDNMLETVYPVEYGSDGGISMDWIYSKVRTLFFIYNIVGSFCWSKYVLVLVNSKILIIYLFMSKGRVMVIDAFS